MGAGAGVTAEMLRGPEAVQMKGRAEQWKGGAEAQGGAEARRGEKKRPGEGGGAERGEAGAERGGIEAMTELTESTDPLVSLWSVSDQ